MFAEEFNEKKKNSNNETIPILINILKEIFPESNSIFNENNTINIPGLINSDLLDKINISPNFKNVMKTTADYLHEHVDGNTNILQAIKNDASILIPEIKKYSKKHINNRSINKVIDILDRDNELTKTKNLNTLFTDYSSNEKSLEELLIDLVKLNTRESNSSNLKSTSNLKKTLYDI